MFFASLEPTSAELITWLLCAAAVVVFADRAHALYQRMQPRPPLDEQLQKLSDTIQKQIKGLTDDCHLKFATKAELTAAQALNAQARESKTNEINRLATRVDNLSHKIDGIPTQVIVLLRETKGLIT